MTKQQRNEPWFGLAVNFLFLLLGVSSALILDEPKGRLVFLLMGLCIMVWWVCRCPK